MRSNHFLLSLLLFVLGAILFSCGLLLSLQRAAAEGYNRINPQEVSFFIGIALMAIGTTLFVVEVVRYVRRKLR